jgi:hypothetical protein
MTQKFVDLSFPLCVKLIAQGKLDWRNIEKIVYLSKCNSSVEWNEKIIHYRENLWSFDPDGCEIVARIMLACEILVHKRFEEHLNNFSKKNAVLLDAETGEVIKL